MDSGSQLDLQPEGNIELIFQLSGRFEQKSVIDEEWSLRPTNFVGGLHSKSFNVKSLDDESRLIGVKFKPLGARHFLPQKLSDYRNKLVDFEDVGIATEQLLTKLHSQETDEVVLDNWLSGIAEDRRKGVVDIALDEIKMTNGFIKISALAKKLNISNSHLRLLFNEQIGMSPKEYSKVLRVQYVLSIVRQEANLKLTELAHRLGYFDQAHFIKDFKSVTDSSPRNFLSIRK